MVLEWFDWPTVGCAIHRAGRLYTRYDLWELGYARHRSGCPVSFEKLCAHKPSCWDKLNARCGLMAGVKAFCVVLYLCPRSCRGLAAAGKQEGTCTPSCYQETKTAFRWAVHSQVPPNGRPSAWCTVFRAHAQSVTYYLQDIGCSIPAP